jgi:ABC-2 type transport system permease protein
MEQTYSQWKAMWAITKASARAIFRSPQAVFFSLFFPIVLIVIFGALSKGGGISVDVAFDKNSDTLNPVYLQLKKAEELDVNYGSAAQIEDKLQKGRITAIISIIPDVESSISGYSVLLKTTSASRQNLGLLQAIIKQKLSEVAVGSPVKEYARIRVEDVPVISGRIYKTIDFYLPGMIGFSLIGSAVFGVAFVFFSLRETLVLKRMYATPVKKGYIVLGESIARILFQLTTVVVLVLFGKYFYDFTLAKGWITFVQILGLSFLGLLVFMGLGFVVSSVAKNQNVIPIYANLFMFPQYFLSGTFFPKSALPQAMQGIIKYLPLTALNDAMRKISFESGGIGAVKIELVILLVWCIVVYAIAIKVFKWE